MGRLALCGALVVILFCGGCARTGQSDTEPAEKAQANGWGAEPYEPCQLVAEGEVTVYDRPGTSSSVCGTTSPDFRVRVEGRTADGWLGFEPGVAQAANAGVFRLRWVEGSGAVRLEGGCGRVPERVGLPAGTCFTIPWDEVQVRAGPDMSSEVLATLLRGDYAAVVGESHSWAEVDLSVGSMGLDITGWVPADSLNLNGSCADLPILEP